MAADDQLNTTLERILTELRSELDGNLRKAAADIVRALASERDRAVNAAAADVRRQAQEQLAQLRDAAKKQNEDVRAAAEAQVGELRAMLEELKRTAQQQIESARTKLDAEIDAVRSRAAADVDEARRSADARIGELERASAERVANIEAELAAARIELDGTRQELDEERQRAHETHQATLRDLDTERERAQQAQQAASRFEREAEHERAERARESASREVAGDDVRGLADATRGLDGSTSLRDVFDRLFEYAAQRAERCALLFVKEDRLEGWRMTGFDQDAASARVELPVSDHGLIGDTVRERRPVRRLQGSDPALPAFAGTADRHAAAFPITVAGVVVAVLYADAAAEPSPDTGWISSLDVVARHASTVLETTTVHRATSLAASSRVARPSQALPGHPRFGSMQ